LTIEFADDTNETSTACLQVALEGESCDVEFKCKEGVPDPGCHAIRFRLQLTDANRSTDCNF
jgi:hypothetical protein